MRQIPVQLIIDDKRLRQILNEYIAPLKVELEQIKARLDAEYDKPVYSLEQAAKLTGISRAKLELLCAKSRVTWHEAPRSIESKPHRRFSRKDVRSILAAMERGWVA